MSPRRDVVPVDPFRERFEAMAATGSASLSSLARDLDWMRSQPGRRTSRLPDVSRVSRVLGISPYSPGHGRPKCLRQSLTLEVATQIADALGLDYHEVGL